MTLRTQATVFLVFWVFLHSQMLDGEYFQQGCQNSAISESSSLICHFVRQEINFFTIEQLR